MILEELIEYANGYDTSKKVVDARAGLGYTCVLLEDGGCGMAYTFRTQLGGHCGTFNGAGTLIGKTAAEMIPWVLSEHKLMAAFGLAAINAVINDRNAEWVEGNIVRVLDVKEDETFGMVGNFGPILSVVSKQTKNIRVFEQNVEKGSGIYPSAMIPFVLPSCDVVVVTATSIINHTIDGVLPYCKNARELCIVGGSAPLAADLFKKFNVSILAGNVVTDEKKLMEIISQGGGTMDMKRVTKQVIKRLR